MAVYVVTGWMRSGTSMLMQCLEAGGLPTLKSGQRDRMADANSDEHYHPNSDGLYELLPTDYQRGEFERDGHVVKVVTPWLHWLKRCDHAVLMLRDPEEIRQSYEAFTGRAPRAEFVGGYEQRMQASRGQLVALGAAVVDLHYRDVLADPLKYFQVLAAIGWPIDAVAAAVAVDPSRCRFRREVLIEGI